jgi:hypothetical protein
MRYIGIRSLPDEAIWRFPLIKSSQGPACEELPSPQLKNLGIFLQWATKCSGNEASYLRRHSCSGKGRAGQKTEYPRRFRDGVGRRRSRRPGGEMGSGHELARPASGRANVRYTAEPHVHPVRGRARRGVRPAGGCAAPRQGVAVPRRLEDFFRAHVGGPLTRPADFPAHEGR